MEPGGQLTTTTVVENYPGFTEGVDANELMNSMRAQAERLGADIRRGSVSRVDFSSRPFRIVIDNGDEIEAEAVIIATGAAAKYLGLPSERKYRGMGVSACATCDGFFYRKKDVAVVGGGDTACEEAAYLAGLCRKVYMIVRRDVLRASKAMQQKVLSLPNIEILWNCNTQEVLGDEFGVTGARLVRKDGTVFDIDIDGFFLAIGHHPNSDLFKEWIATDGQGYIITYGGKLKWLPPATAAAAPTSRAFLPQAMSRTQATVRPSMPLQQAVVPLWMRRSTCSDFRMNLQPY